MSNKKPRNRPVRFMRNVRFELVITEKNNLMNSRGLMRVERDGVLESTPYTISSDKGIQKRYTGTGDRGHSFRVTYVTVDGSYLMQGDRLVEIKDSDYDKVEILSDWENSPSGRTTNHPDFKPDKVIDTLDHGNSRPTSIAHLTLEEDGYYLNTIGEAMGEDNWFGKTLLYSFADEESNGNLWAKTQKGWVKAEAVHVKTSNGWVRSEENVKAKTEKGWR